MYECISLSMGCPTLERASEPLHPKASRLCMALQIKKLRQIPLSLPISQQADEPSSITSELLKVFLKRPHGTWMTSPEILQELMALGGAASQSSNPENSIPCLLYSHKSADGTNSFLKRRIVHPGSTQKVTEFAMGKMTCKGCKLPRDSTREIRMCDCCKAVWHVKCHKSKAPLSVNRWFCSSLCAEKARLRSEKLKAKKQKKKPAEEVPQPSARKRKGPIRFDEVQEGEAQPSAARNRKSTTPFDEIQKEEPQRSARKRKTPIPFDEIQEAEAQRCAARKRNSAVQAAKVQEGEPQRSASKQKTAVLSEYVQVEGHEVRSCTLT